MNKKWSENDILFLKENIHKSLDELSILLNRTKQSIKGKKRKINYDSSNNKKINEINWNKVQDYYNNNKTWDDIVNDLNINYNIINKAIKLGFIKSRNISDANKLSYIKKPRILSEETKKKISESRIKYLKENPDKVPYLLNHYSKGESYPEEYFDKIFKKNKLKYEKQLRISIYQLDFAFIENGINIEIDGEQHYVDSRIIESNKRKDSFLKDNGWNVIRIRWSEYQKMNKNDKEKYINDLIDYINKKTNYLQFIIINNGKQNKIKTIKKIYCVDCGKEIYKTSMRCNKCNGIYNQKNIKPSLEQLLIDVNNLGYRGTGRKYNVSDTCIRKWIKKYNN